MIVTTEGEYTVRIRFFHSPPQEADRRRYTTCTIEAHGPKHRDWITVGSAASYCGKGDAFRRETGRQLSIRRAYANARAYGVRYCPDLRPALEKAIHDYFRSRSRKAVTRVLHSREQVRVLPAVQPTDLIDGL